MSARGANVVEHRDLDVGDGLTLHVATSGSGSPVMLLHGFTGSGESWNAMRRALEPRHTVITVDLPGHGQSGAPEDAGRYALPRLADDLSRVLDLLGVDQVALVGYSMGGRAALHFAVRHASRLSALVLESTSPGIADEEERVARQVSDADLARRIERDGMESFVRHWQSLPLWESQRALDDSARQALHAQRMRNSARGLANSLRGAGAGSEPSLLDRLAEVTVPALVVAGALDSRYVAIAESMARALPRARLAVVAGAGHAVHLERAAELAELVLDFLRVR